MGLEWVWALQLEEQWGLVSLVSPSALQWVVQLEEQEVG